MEMYARCLTRDTAEGPFTDHEPVLGRPLVKGRKVVGGKLATAARKAFVLP